MKGRRSRASRDISRDERLKPVPPPDLRKVLENSNDTDGGKDDEKLDRRQEVWEAFREEHYEAVEQLPLSLHRQFTLMRELDEQTQGYSNELLLSLQKYIRLRQSATSCSRPDLSSPVKELGIECLEREPCPNVTSNSLSGTSSAGPDPLLQQSVTPKTFASISIPSDRRKRPTSSRELLSRVAFLSEELLRASEEKVNLAQASYDSVDRHIRLLDQAIKEHETSILLGIRSGTQPAPIVLPDLVVPRWARQSRVTLSPEPSPMSGEIQVDTLGTSNGDSRPTIGVVFIHRPDGTQPQQKNNKKANAKSKKKKPEHVQEVAVDHHRRESRSLRLTVPSQSAASQDLIVDPNEPRYCYCNQVSFGEMVACDNKRCKRQWFHLSCAGLTQAPPKKEKWYCRDCTPGQSGRRH